MRATLPLVCKRWRDAIYSAKGDFDLMHGIMMLGQCETGPSTTLAERPQKRTALYMLTCH